MFILKILVTPTPFRVLDGLSYNNPSKTRLKRLQKVSFKKPKDYKKLNMMIDDAHSAKPQTPC